jgi:hypothetical protein
MPRTIVDIPISQLQDLDALCGTLRISRAEGVRRALDRYLRLGDADSREGFGLWRQADAPGQCGQCQEPR